MCFRLLIIIFAVLPQLFCQSTGQQSEATRDLEKNTGEAVLPGAYVMENYLSLLENKSIGLVVNHTSTVYDRHLLDTLIGSGIRVRRIFSPEHGFRGTADAGAHIKDQVDPTSGIPVISLYGEKRKPGREDLSGIDLIVFDIQDVGARFYTYISTMHHVMSACAEHNIPFMVLDRPNPNGHYVDGPIREKAFTSFVGMHAVPVVYGMTIGEYAQMINGEGWLENGAKCDLKIIPCQNYAHQTMYALPIPPSPNLPNLRSVLLYPSLCFFEGTPLSIGRGTNTQFQVIGHPDVQGTDTFTPGPAYGAQNPKLNGLLCNGETFTSIPPEQIFQEARINLSHLIKYYRLFPDKEQFFNKNRWVDKLAGTTTLRQDIIGGKSEEEIRAGWQPGLEAFKKIREKYLLYK
jgi:uncharacterized protein YbbC (DUF1343 family)